MPESNTPPGNSPYEFAGTIEICPEDDPGLDSTRAEAIVRRILGDGGFRRGAISIAIVDDPAIHQLNRRYLSHDWATDVLSFVLEEDRESGMLEGEIIVSCDTARREAPNWHWPAEHELFLYVIHGALHLTGMDDSTDELRAEMNAAEDRYLALAGIRGQTGAPLAGGTTP